MELAEVGHSLVSEEGDVFVALVSGDPEPTKLVDTWAKVEKARASNRPILGVSVSPAEDFGDPVASLPHSDDWLFVNAQKGDFSALITAVRNVSDQDSKNLSGAPESEQKKLSLQFNKNARHLTQNARQWAQEHDLGEKAKRAKRIGGLLAIGAFGALGLREAMQSEQEKSQQKDSLVRYYESVSKLLNSVSQEVQNAYPQSSREYIEFASRFHELLGELKRTDPPPDPSIVRTHEQIVSHLREFEHKYSEAIQKRETEDERTAQNALEKVNRELIAVAQSQRSLLDDVVRRYKQSS
ncbi:hypothetical protein E6W39_29250 [Kitasatospora acidiphila]|uniref:Uncharacterized protein n=1 Tax=Kitasatospora acidiphila TaxID=2567942 RepID=A0A540W9A7_9ACTN|nr:hypothetical protein [Kitasatospora acidiphila]TQF05572.1 hypothetical protein E6W39_29250 [Kitasatospora acidiphila]